MSDWLDGLDHTGCNQLVFVLQNNVKSAQPYRGPLDADRLTENVHVAMNPRALAGHQLRRIGLVVGKSPPRSYFFRRQNGRCQHAKIYYEY
jgi:hypothetical protein